MYDEGTTMLYALYVDMDTVADFEIYDDTVYFCGKKKSAVGGAAVMGFFDVASLMSMASANVAYLRVLPMESLDAIEVAAFSGRKHAVTIGAGLKDEAVVLDAVDETTHWEMNFGKLDEGSYVLKDLAITREHVVVTSRTANHVSASYRGRLWYIKKPAATGGSLFPGTVEYDDLDSNLFLRDRFMIHSMGGDGFVTAFHAGLYVVGSNPFVVSFYNIITNITYSGSVVINESSPYPFELGDIVSYDKSSQSVALLIYGRPDINSGVLYRSLIYEIPHSVPLPSFVSAHVYDGIYLSSLDLRHGISGLHFVAAGIQQPGTIGAQYTVKFRQGSFGGHCLYRNYNEIKDFGIDHDRDYHNIPLTKILQLPEEAMGDRKDMRVETLCNSLSDEIEQ